MTRTSFQLMVTLAGWIASSQILAANPKVKPTEALKAGESRWEKMPDGTMVRRFGSTEAQHFGPGLHFMTTTLSAEMKTARYQIRDAQDKTVLEGPMYATNSLFRNFMVEYQTLEPTFKPGDTYYPCLQATDADNIGILATKKGQVVATLADQSFGEGAVGWDCGGFSGFIYNPQAPNKNLPKLPVPLNPETLRQFRKANTLAMLPDDETFEAVFETLSERDYQKREDPAEESELRENLKSWLALHENAARSRLKAAGKGHSSWSKILLWLPAKEGEKPLGTPYKILYDQYSAGKLLNFIEEMRPGILNTDDLMALRRAPQRPIQSKEFWALLKSKGMPDADFRKLLREAWILEGDKEAHDLLMQGCHAEDADALALSRIRGNMDQPFVDYCARCSQPTLKLLKESLARSSDSYHGHDERMTLSILSKMEDVDLLNALSRYSRSLGFELEPVVEMARSRQNWILRLALAETLHTWLGEEDAGLAAISWLNKGESHPWVKAQLISLLPQDKPESLTYAQSALTDSDPALRATAFLALSHGASADLTQNLAIRLLAQDPEPVLRELALKWLSDRPAHPDAQRALSNAQGRIIRGGKLPISRPWGLDFGPTDPTKGWQGPQLRLWGNISYQIAQRARKNRGDEAAQQRHQRQAMVNVPLHVEGESESRRAKRLAQALASTLTARESSNKIIESLKDLKNDANFNILLKAIETAQNDQFQTLIWAVKRGHPNRAQTQQVAKILEQRAFGPKAVDASAAINSLADAVTVLGREECARLLTRTLEAAKNPYEAGSYLHPFAEAFDRASSSNAPVVWGVDYNCDDGSESGQGDGEYGEPKRPDDGPSSRLILNFAATHPKQWGVLLRWLAQNQGVGAMQAIEERLNDGDFDQKIEIWAALDVLANRLRRPFNAKADETFRLALKDAWAEGQHKDDLLRVLALAGVDGIEPDGGRTGYRYGTWIEYYLFRLRTPWADERLLKIAESVTDENTRRALARCVQGRSPTVQEALLNKLLPKAPPLGEPKAGALSGLVEVATQARALTLTSMAQSLVRLAPWVLGNDNDRAYGAALAGLNYPSKGADLLGLFQKYDKSLQICTFALRALGQDEKIVQHTATLIQLGLDDWRPEVRREAKAALKRADSQSKDAWIKKQSKSKVKKWELDERNGYDY